MAGSKTNFALLLELLGVRPRDIVAGVGADKSLVKVYRAALSSSSN